MWLLTALQQLMALTAATPSNHGLFVIAAVRGQHVTQPTQCQALLAASLMCAPIQLLLGCLSYLHIIPLTCRDLLSDLAYSSQADVLLGVHGDSLFNAFFMRKHSSVIEIRPLNFTGRLPNQYMKVRCLSSWLTCYL